MSYVDRIPKEEYKNYISIGIPDSVSEDGSLFLYKNIINEELKVSKDVKSVFILDCYFTDNVIINGNLLSELVITDSYFDKDIVIKQVVVSDNDSTLISENHIGGNVLISDSEFKDCSVSFFECKEFEVVRAKFTRLDLSNAVDFKADDISYTNTSFSKVRIWNSQGGFTLENFDAEVCNVQVLKNNSTLTLNNVKANLLVLYDLVNMPVRLFNVSSIQYLESELRLLNCSLTNAELFKLDLSSFNSLIFNGTNFTNTTFANVKWNFNIAKSVGNSHDQRETYRQLKYALGKQGDTINEQKFHTLEMRAHYKSLDWDTDGWNKAIIWLSYNTSNFGQSIWWPIRALFVGHSLFFLIAMLTGLSSVHISFANASWSAFNTAIYEYFYLINPLHKTEDLPKDWTIIIDIFMRIWSSYMIYNIIRASRRFIK